MENHQGSRLFGRNIFADAFQQFDEESFFSSLHHQVKNKSYYERYRGFKQTVTVLSYIFSVAGALTSAYAVYWLASWAGATLWLSLTIGGLILAFLERIKRKASEEAWQVYFFQGKIALGWVLLSLALFVVGVLSSSFGAKEGARDFAPLADLITSDTTAEGYSHRVAVLEAENQRLSSQRNSKGEIYWPAQQQMARNKQIIAQYEGRILSLDSKREQANDGIKASHETSVAFAARVFMIVQIGMELCFEACIAWIWYFFYRSYVERRQIVGISDDDASSPSLSPGHILPPNGLNAPPGVDSRLIAQIVAKTLEHMQPLPEAPGSPPPPGNGQKNTMTNQHYGTPLPIGFFTPSQRASQLSPDSSVQACTEVYRESEDLYTVLHHYTRGGKTYQTPYTRNQIMSRINQYEREVMEAITRKMGEEVIENRRQWLAYWQSKLVELEQKLQILSK